MSISRRKLLTTAAIAAPAAVAASLPAAVTAATAAVLPAVAYPFEWYFSYDGEAYSDSFYTMEAALQCLKNEGEGMIAECQRQDFSLDVDGSEILELLYGHNEEITGEGEFIDCTRDQELDLGRMVTAAIEQWVVKNKIDTVAWAFGNVRNQTTFAERFAPTKAEDAELERTSHL